MQARIAGWVLVGMGLVACTLPLRAQSPLLSPSQLEPLPQIQPAPVEGPALDYSDLDGWLADNAGPTVPRDDWNWQILPDGIIYKAYLANPKESRLGSQIFSQKGDGTLWDSTLGGRVGFLRYGTYDTAWPQGWQLDLEGSAQVRLNPGENLDLQSTDYRVGVPLT